MTVCLALVCQDGVIVAADSMGSDSNTATVRKKVHVFDNRPFVWTASGSVHTIEEVEIELANLASAHGENNSPPKYLSDPQIALIRTKFQASVQKAMAVAYKAVLTHDGLGALRDNQFAIHPAFAADFMVAGYSNGVPWLLELHHSGQLNWHTDDGFYALGSGGPFATVACGLMSHYLVDRPSMEDGKLVAYRAIETTIAVSNSSVGPPVRIGVCDASGARILDEEEMSAIKTEVDRWKEIERESLTNLRAGDPEALDNDLPSFARS